MKEEPRRVTRRHIFNIIFEYDFEKENAENSINKYFDIIDYEKEQENEAELSESVMDKEFINSEISGIIKNIEDIDDTISKYAVGWSVDRLAKVDLAILRVAVYEILYVENIPVGVSANEAVELAKDYGGEKSPSFINGILSAIIKNERERI